MGDNIGINANIGLRDARAGYHVAAELQGIEVGASAEIKFASLDIYFEVFTSFFDYIVYTHNCTGFHAPGSKRWTAADQV